MTLAMQQALLRRGCARLTESLAECRDLPAGELMLAREAMTAVLGMASRGPMLALPWREKPIADHKMRAANDDPYADS
jgi:hypothetical protein